MNTKIEINNNVDSRTKASVHLFVVPSILAFISWIIDPSFTIVSSIVYVIVITIFFNLKSLIVINNSSKEDRKAFNSLLSNILGVLLLLCVLIICLVLVF